MISEKLQHKIHLAEMGAFPIWQKANKKERERIVRKLGNWSGNLILKEIREDVEKMYAKNESKN